MLSGDCTVVQAYGLDGLSFNPFSFQEDCPAAPEVDVGRCQIADGLVVTLLVHAQKSKMPSKCSVRCAAVIPSSACSRFCSPSVPFSIGAYRCQAFSDFSIDAVLMSVAGSALLFGIGTEALP